MTILSSLISYGDTTMNNISINSLINISSNSIFNNTTILSSLYVSNNSIINNITTNNILNINNAVCNNISVLSSIYVSGNTIFNTDINILSDLNITGNTNINGYIASNPILLFGILDTSNLSYSANNTIQFTSIIDNYNCWNNNSFTVPISGYYNINCYLSISNSSSTILVDSQLTRNNIQISSNSIIFMDSNNINYTSSGFYTYNCIQGDVINIINKNNNSIYNIGGLEINLI
jgi:hypothetical protein